MRLSSRRSQSGLLAAILLRLLLLRFIAGLALALGFRLGPLASLVHAGKAVFVYVLLVGRSRLVFVLMFEPSIEIGVTHGSSSSNGVRESQPKLQAKYRIDPTLLVA
jgi:hypothetical protein